MITTVTLNPSLDLTLDVDEAIVIGRVGRASSERLEAAGKGVNVAMALTAHGHAARALAAMDPAAAPRYLELLPEPHVVQVIPVTGLIRTNVAIVEPFGVVTKVNGPGPAYDAPTLDSVIAAVASAAADTRWLVLSGSLPPGCPDDTYARLSVRARELGCRVAIDADGGALRAGVAAGPDLVKPNRTELEALTGSTIATIGDAIDAGRQVLAAGVGAVLCSVGADGALLIRDREVVHAWAPSFDVASHVGAGDALLAGYLSRAEEGLPALRAAVAWGAAACRLPGTQMPAPGEINESAVSVATNPDRTRRLSGHAAAPLTQP